MRPARLATPNHESACRDTVEREGNGDLLLQAFTTGASHCAFTTAQDLAAVDAMVSWLDNRAKPDPAVYFPATLGFVPNYVPPAWPW